MLRNIPHIALFLWPVARAEEATVLSNARVIGSEIDSDWCPDSQVLISGFFKTFCTVDTGSSGDKEFMIDL